ncbi:MAG: glycosyltransferase family 4 protein [Gammaproteobacteria bacterium]|nr:glycosyltransferase family 4 protein [Gammaproteobacteria bacterium]
MIFLYLSLPMLISAVLVYFLSRQSSGLAMLDLPNERSLHTRPVNRTGGIGILLGIVLTCLLVFVIESMPENFLAIMAGLFMVAGISLIDDKRGVSIKIRLLIHILAGFVLVSQGGFLFNHFELPYILIEIPNWLAYLFTLLFIIWSINLYNFMDGMDGLAAGMAVIGFGAFALLGLIKGAYFFTLISAIIAMSNLGFLLYNFPPAKIFMGDTGSSVLGYLMAALILWADTAGIFPLWVGFLVFSPFILDATWTLLRRAVAKEKVWEAHRTHLYQRLVLSGWGHRRTVLYEYAVMMVCAVGSFMAVYFDSNILSVGMFFVLFITYLLLLLKVSKKQLNGNSENNYAK